MITRTELATYLNDYLACANFQDYAPNGLQVEGRSKINRICTAVTASEQTIMQAVELEADALLVHHGFFWRGEDSVITGMRRRRIGQLILNDMNLLAYHLPLDCHPTLGNNVCLADELELTDLKSHHAGKTPNLLWSGKLSRALSAQELSEHIKTSLQRPPLYVGGSDKLIQHIAWCTGGAQDLIEEASQLGVDAYLSGEVSERTYYQAQELNTHYFACGHHATERYGIQALGLHLASQFNLVHHFIDSENPI